MSLIVKSTLFEYFLRSKGGKITIDPYFHFEVFSYDDHFFNKICLWKFLINGSISFEYLSYYVDKLYKWQIFKLAQSILDKLGE